ncbi:WD40 repeat domain-containing protein [Sphaerospermopsis aphanizomenoides BCCUSP55]|uniref:WD40 repeat domain-containing protein n=1 Tax=Sphaerospermopsis aphanizomenoides TaxID=459663 RepID=UPI001908C400|nr:WD40 repeat domain-containing protein [Sphaerospermopsis aphanizomenoides]MBK1986746.1 WD40 repeat domain-containing protein [Sphaerospermopsis aphanizomenoides BCCUSP55]
MQPGLNLLLQLVLEFAPVMVNIIQKQTESNSKNNISPIPKVLHDFIATVDNVTQIDIKKAEFTQQQQLAIYHHATQLKIANQERETAIKLPEVHKILDSWPLRLYPSQLLESAANYQRTPLKVFIAAPQIQFDKFDLQNSQVTDEIELKLGEGLREFINNHYSLHHPERPIEFLAGAWDSKRFHSESSIKALFSGLKTQPTLVLESEKDGDYLNFRIAYWGLGQENYYYKTISRLPYRQILQASAKNRALEWRNVKNQLLALGEDVEVINNLGQERNFNLELLEKVEKWQSQGIDVGQLPIEYKTSNQDWQHLYQILITCHCLVTAWVTDVYYLVNYDVHPLLPELLTSLLNDAINLESLQVITDSYKQVYQALKNERIAKVPELALQLAQGLSHLSNSDWSREQVDYSIETWLQIRQVSTTEVTHPLQAMQLAVKIEDENYITKLKEYFAAVGDNQNLVYVETILEGIATLKNKHNLEKVNLHHTLTGHSGKVSSVAISPDGQVLVSGCADQTINIWHLQTGQLIRTLTGNLGAISSVAVSPDGNLIAVGSCEHPQSNVKVWNLKTGQLIHTLLGHQKPVNVVAISADGSILASGSHKIKIWSLQKGERICTLWHSSTVDAIAISADGSILASGSSDYKIRLWNPRTGDPLRTMIGHLGEVTSIAISANGKFLFSGSADKTIKIWHLSTGKLLNTWNGHTDKIKSIAVSPNGEFLFSGSVDKTIKMWEISTGEVLQTLTGHSGGITSLSLSADGKFLASGSADKTVKIWQVMK